MNRIQKIAWCFVVTGGISVILCGICFVLLYWKYGMAKASIAIAFLGIFGIAGIAPLVIKKDPGKVTYDERDRIIHLEASRAAFAIFFIAMCLLAFVVMPLLRGKNGSLTVNELGALLLIASIPFWLGYAITILLLYARKEKNNE